MKDEEMAEEWVKENMDCVKTVSCLNHDCNYFSDEERSIAKSAFKDGYNKANEWHYVKDRDLPKDDIKLAIIEIDDCGYLLCNYRNGFWYDANSGATCAEWITNNIIAWKEIVLPKESE